MFFDRMFITIVVIIVALGVLVRVAFSGVSDTVKLIVLCAMVVVVGVDLIYLGVIEPHR